MKMKKCIVLINVFLLLFSICAPLGYAYENDIVTNEEEITNEIIDDGIIVENIDNETIENTEVNEADTAEVDNNIIVNDIVETVSDDIIVVDSNEVNSINDEINNKIVDIVEDKVNNDVEFNDVVVQEETVQEEAEPENIVQEEVVEYQEVETSGTMSNTPSILYSTHIQNVGWQKEKADGQLSGTEGKALRLEAIKIHLKDAEGDVIYQTHVQNIGWQQEKSNGQLSGTEGKALRLEAIKIKLNGKVSELYSIKYRVHVENLGWLGWAKDGEIAGTEGFGYRLEAIEIKLDTKNEGGLLSSSKSFYRNTPSIAHKTHVQNIGWSAESDKCECIGTIGRGLRLEALQMRVFNTSLKGSIEYSTHVQNIGWQDFVKDGNTSGSTGKGLRIEAIKIRLTGELQDNYDIYYRAHCQNVGWLDWAKNGDIAGTTGCAYRLEAIHIVIVNKNSAGPGSMVTSYLTNQKGKIYLDTPIETHLGASNKTMKIEGWALSSSNDTYVKVYMDGTEIDGIERIKRDDVLNAYPNYKAKNPKPGFIKQIDFTQLTNQRHEIKVVLYDTKLKCTLATENRYFVKYKDIRFGIDVSRHNAHGSGGYQRIDWATVKNHVDFAIVRCGYGQNLDDNGGYRQDDDEFYYNMNACKKYNIPVEVYLYSYADTTTKAFNEAEHVLRLCKNYKDIVHMIWYDVEDDYLFKKVKSGQVSKSAVGEIVNTFAEKLMVNGYKVGIYSYKSALQSYFPTETINRYDIWLAHFVNGVDRQNVLNNMSSYPGTYVMWQYSSTGTVPGITTEVDCNLRFVDFY